MRRLTTEQIDHARELHARGFTYRSIGKAFECSEGTVQRALNPEANRAYRKRQQEKRSILRAELAKIERPSFRPTEAEYRHALSLIPPDTRDLTQRTFGDPVFERSALYRSKFHEPARFGDHPRSPSEGSIAGG